MCQWHIFLLILIVFATRFRERIWNPTWEVKLNRCRPDQFGKGAKLSYSGRFFNFGEFAVEGGKADPEKLSGFFFVPSGERERAIKVGNFLVTEESFQVAK